MKTYTQSNCLGLAKASGKKGPLSRGMRSEYESGRPRRRGGGVRFGSFQGVSSCHRLPLYGGSKPNEK